MAGSKKKKADLRIEVLATGNELLDGSILDRHTQSIATKLKPTGLKISRMGIVSDEIEELRLGLLESFSRSDVVIVSGGLGPTTDDRTLEVAAKCFGSEMIEDRGAKENVKNLLKRFGRLEKLNDGHRKMFLIPKGSKALSNIAGAAPAVQWQIGDKTLFFLPGPPHEFNRVFDEHLISWFRKRATTEGQFLFVLKVFGWPESSLSQLVEKIKLPAGVEEGFRTSLPENHIKFFVKSASEAAAKKKIAPVLKKLKSKLGDDLFSESMDSFEESIFNKLLKNKSVVSIAESCTGGLASSMLTAVNGSSKVFDRSFVTYSNEAKIDLLGVSAKTLSKHGAVSKETAIEMAEGALARSKANRSISITGIAGPTGGNSTKPVGTIWMARAVKGRKTETKLLKLHYERDLNRKYSAYAALHWLAQA